MKKIMSIAVIIVVAVLTVAATQANAEEKNIIVKNGSTIMVYTIRYYNEEAYRIDTNTYHNCDVSTLSGLGIPQEAWPAFANNQYLIFSNDAFQLQQEKEELSNQLANTQDELANTQSGRMLFKILFIIAAVIIVIGIIVAVFNSK